MSSKSTLLAWWIRIYDNGNWPTPGKGVTLCSNSITIWSQQHKIIRFKIVSMTGNIAVSHSQLAFRENAHSRVSTCALHLQNREKRNATEFALSGGQGRNCEKYGAQMTLTGWSAQTQDLPWLQWLSLSTRIRGTQLNSTQGRRHTTEFLAGAAKNEGRRREVLPML